MKTIILFASLFFCGQFVSGQAGKLDSSFGAHGIVAADLGLPYNYGFSAKKVLWQPDGSIYLIIQAGLQMIIAKRLSDGSADSSFGHNGFNDPVTINANDAAIRQDGKIVVVGRTNGRDFYNFEILRYNKDGSLDHSFSGDGKVITDFSESSYTEATSVAVQSDGKIVAAGIASINTFEDEIGPFAYCIARYNIDGSLDNTFSGDGKVTDSPFAGANTIAIQQDGKIVIAGGDVSNSAAFGIARYKTNGSLDSTFSGDGIQATDFGFDAKSAAIQKDGKILIAGKNYSYHFTLARLNKDGNLDSTFSSDGILTNNLLGEANAVTAGTDGKIIALGTAGIARYNTNGSSDSTFNGNGVMLFSSGNAESIALQSDKKIVAAGSIFVRYNTDGSTDKKFNKGGKLPLNIHPGLTSFSNTKIQKDGKIVAAGNTWNGSNISFVIARFNSDGRVDSTFGKDGTQLTSVSTGEHYINSINIQKDGKIVITGEVFGTCNENNCFTYYILRYNANGSLDSTFSDDGVQPADFQINSATLQNDDKIIVAGASDGNFTIARFKTNGSLDSTFSTDGKQVTIFSDEQDGGYANSAAVQKDGKIVAGGIVKDPYPTYVIIRYNTDGSPDSSAFGGGLFLFSDASAGSVVIQNDGKIVVAGSENYRGSKQFDVVRFNSNGTLDSSFSKDGRQQLEVNMSDYATSAAVQNDGKILVAGSAIIRFNKNGSLDSAFGNKGIVLTEESEGNEFVNDIAVSDNKLYAVGSGSYAGAVGIIARFLLNASTNTTPIVSITAPANNAKFLAPANVKLSAAASNSDGTITKVEFYNSNTLLHTETAVPYGYYWKNVPAGNYTLAAKAYDNSGNVTTSAAVHISVVANKPPVVSIIKPADNQSFAAPAYIHFEAAASDSDGRITRVEFYNGSALLRTEYKYPYTYVWKNVSAGTYTITAVATDNWGAQTTSAPVTVRVTSASAIVSNRLYSQNEKIALNDALSLRLSPNPAHSVLNIFTKGLPLTKPVTLSIISTSGIVLKTINISNRATQLDVSSIASGVYTVKIFSEDKVIYKQFDKL